ncbi:hypothetical protein CEXT_669981 [Caerostris extrusa]|uniref:Uncharacterized protein n=1 Tax=Caerostris extrusa TaxID=172846 RepID=A0AAV4NZ82_CAEEX|nr:hypothetical protein CEXT_669981 [Caerostris extrusa]
MHRILEQETGERYGMPASPVLKAERTSGCRVPGDEMNKREDTFQTKADDLLYQRLKGFIISPEETENFDC